MGSQAALTLAKCSFEVLLKDEASSPGLCWPSQTHLPSPAESFLQNPPGPCQFLCVVQLVCISHGEGVSWQCAGPGSHTWVVQRGYTHVCISALSPETWSGDLFSFLRHVAPWHLQRPLGSRYIPLLSLCDLGQRLI